MKTRLLPLILTLILGLTMPSTTSFATSCPNDSESRSRIETLRDGADESEAYGRLRLALALKIEEACALRDQRNAALADVQDTETERDNLAGRIGQAERQTAQERQKADERLVENVRLTDRVSDLERRPKRWVVVVLVSVAIAVGGAGGYGVARVLP